MNTISKTSLICFTFAASTAVSYAQPILLGCSASLTGQPMTTSNIVDIDPMTGAATNARNTGVYGLAGIAIQPTSGLLYGLTSVVSTPANSLIRIDPVTGSVNVVGPTGLPSIIEGDLAFNPIDGMLYGIQDAGPSFMQSNLFRINPNNGVSTIVGNTGSNGDLSALAFNSSGTLFAIDSGGLANSTLLTIDPVTAFITSTTNLNVNLGSAVGMTIDPNSGIAFVADGGDTNPMSFLYTLDLANGTMNTVGPTGILGGISGLTAVPIPEPSSAVLIVLAGLIVIKPLSRRGRAFHQTQISTT